MAQPTKVFVGSLPQGTKPEELRRLFENYGIVVECDVMNRCGFVHMKNPTMAENAIMALHESQFKGQNIVVEFGRPKERKQGAIGGVVNQGGGGGPRNGRGGNRGIMVGFPGKQTSNSFDQATTLQLAGVIMELLGDQQSQVDDISGGNNNMIGCGGDDGYRRVGSGGGGGGRGRGGNFQGNRGGNQNTNGVGPMRGQGFKGDRPAPYPQSMNMGDSNIGNHSGGNSGARFNNQPNRGSTASNYNNARGSNYGPKAGVGNNSWSNDQRSSIQHGGRNFAEDTFSGGFSGNMGNSSGSNFGGQQDRRGFALPSNQFQQYGGGGGNQLGGFGSNDDSAPFVEEPIFQRRNNPINAPVIIDFRSTGKSGGNLAGGNFNRGGYQGARGDGQGSFQNNRGGQGFQQGGSFKRGVPGGNNINSGDSYQQNFPPLRGSGLGGQGGFGGNNRNHGAQVVGRGAGGGGMNRNAPRQNMPNRRY